MAMSQHCEEPGCSFQTLEGRYRRLLITWLYSMC